jgi:phosphatidylcholine synthase
VNDCRPSSASLGRKILAWGVHLYTGSGLLLAAWIVSLLLQPDRTADTYRICFLLMLIATLIDATDGTLARMVRIKETLPGFDGRRLDDLVDFLMYTCLPLLLIERAGLLPPNWNWVLLVAFGASAYGFSQSDVKTADGSFLGFPSYWNIVAFYLYMLPITDEAAVIIIGLALLTFVPIRYPYPTQRGRVNRIMLALSVPWAAIVLVIVVTSWDDGVPRGLSRASAVYPLLYLATAWGMSFRRRID